MPDTDKTNKFDPSKNTDKDTDTNKAKHKDGNKDFSKTIEQKQERKLFARVHADETAWFGLGMFGMVGWSVAIPCVAGAFIGIWIDRTWPSRPSWTLTLLLLGMAIGCWNAWYWIKREGKDRD